MCGIVGFVGEETAVEAVMTGLERLEYRGYDSAGVASVVDGRIERRRKQGKLRNLQEALREQPIAGSLAIGHTRWATHGRPSDENAHPHQVDDVVLVHNGIIENYLPLRRQLEDEGRRFDSETDTEVIAHLVARESGDLESRVRQAVTHLRGAYAIAVISAKEPDTLIAVKNASPLIVGHLDGGGMLASDIPALLPYTRDVRVLDEGELARMQRDGIWVGPLEGSLSKAEFQRIDWSPVMAEKGGHKHFMHKEIHEQPRALADTLRGRVATSGDDVVFDSDVASLCAEAERVVLTGCGTSWHAGLVGRRMLEELAKLPCEIDLASELRYRAPITNEKTVVIAVSQSGETADTLAVVNTAKERGAKVVAVVNVLGSSIARRADHVIYTHAGPEIGVASTKAFVTQVAALVLLCVGVARRRDQLSAGEARELLGALVELPRLLGESLEQEAEVLKVAQAVKQARSAIFIGRGYGMPVALEGALKLKEISYIHAEGYAAGELKHGPIALIEAGLPLVAIATNGPLYEKVISNVQEARARDALVVAVATDGNRAVEDFADLVLWVPESHPLLTPILATLPLQLLSYHVADMRGTDIDQPRNLAKSVTVE